MLVLLGSSIQLTSVHSCQESLHKARAELTFQDWVEKSLSSPKAPCQFVLVNDDLGALVSLRGASHAY